VKYINPQKKHFDLGQQTAVSMFDAETARVLAALYHDAMSLAEVIAISSDCRASPAHHRSRFRRPCGLSIVPAAENDQIVKRPPIVGAVLLVWR